MNTVGLLIVIAMAPFATLNAILYGAFFPWRKSREGKATFHLYLSLALLVLASVLYSLVPAFPAKPYVAVVVYTLILASLARTTVALVRLLWARHRHTHA